jgi:hypothetical protein
MLRAAFALKTRQPTMSSEEARKDSVPENVTIPFLPLGTKAQHLPATGWLVCDRVGVSSDACIIRPSFRTALLLPMGHMPAGGVVCKGDTVRTLPLPTAQQHPKGTQHPCSTQIIRLTRGGVPIQSEVG